MVDPGIFVDFPKDFAQILVCLLLVQVLIAPRLDHYRSGAVNASVMIKQRCVYDLASDAEP